MHSSVVMSPSMIFSSPMALASICSASIGKMYNPLIFRPFCSPFSAEC
jgi:hypothetical protein